MLHLVRLLVCSVCTRYSQGGHLKSVKICINDWSNKLWPQEGVPSNPDVAIFIADSTFSWSKFSCVMVDSCMAGLWHNNLEVSILFVPSL